MQSTQKLWAVFSLALVGILLFSGQGDAKELRSPHPKESLKLIQGKCQHCHAPDKQLKTDVSQSECQECHGLPTPKNLPIQVENFESPEVIAQKLIKIPAGSFIMGSPGRPAAEGRGNADEGPPHEVYVEDFYIDLYETTNAHYQDYLVASKAKPPLLWKKGVFPTKIANHPVVYVSWHDADTYCRWAGKRLATEAEWEKAARGNDQRNFPWGKQFDFKKANTPQYWLSQGIEVYKGSTMVVGSFESGKSPYGLYDMGGNVYEWVDNWYQPYPGNQYPNVHYGKRNKVLRGGSWYDCMSYGCGLSAPVYNRSRFTPEIKNKGFGFRCASDTATPIQQKQSPKHGKQS